jgi:hypothetical protein
MDPLHPPHRKAWWLLFPGQTATVHFHGTRLAILTMIGPDSGTVTCEVQTVLKAEPGIAQTVPEPDPGIATHGPSSSTTNDKKTLGPRGGAGAALNTRNLEAGASTAFPRPVSSCTTRRLLLDRWSYFWRVGVVTLAESLPRGRHVARVGLEKKKTDPAVMKRPPAGAEWERCVAEGKDHKLWLMYWLVGA